MALALTLSSILQVVIISYTKQTLSSLSPGQSGLLNREQSNQYNFACNLDICDSLVSKCKLTDRCSCDSKLKRPIDALCAKDCIDCLEEKFGKCCACVGLCPRVGDSEIHSSHVGETTCDDQDQQLFEVLTETDDLHGRWTVERSSDGKQFLHPIEGEVEFAYRAGTNNSIDLSHDTSLEKLDCTVAFINKFLSMAKCKSSCTTMGARYFRWFHHGCCECVSRYCLNYGFPEPHCNMDSD